MVCLRRYCCLGAAASEEDLPARCDDDDAQQPPVLQSPVVQLRSPATPISGGGKARCSCKALDSQGKRCGNSCGCKRSGRACSAACGCQGDAACCGWNAFGDVSAAPLGYSSPASGRKTKLRLELPSDASAQAWASLYSQLVRDEALRSCAAVLARPDRTVCAYSLRPRPFEALDVEHLVEGQMDGFVLVKCAEAHAFLRPRLRAVDLNLAGYVKQSVLQPYYGVHNDQFNLTFAEHALNMKKKSGVAASLKQLWAGREVERGLHGALTGYLPSGTQPVDDDVADVQASRIVTAMRTSLHEYTERLESVGDGAPAFSLLQRRDAAQAARVYAALGEEMAQLGQQLGL